MKKYLNRIVPFILAFCVVNGIAFGYKYDPIWIKRDGGLTKGLYIPGSRVINNEEGYGYGIIDENGYANYSAELREDYVLVFGNSQSNGHNVHYTDTYIYILNKLFNSLEETYVYNISNGGFTICDIVKGFKAGITEFPDSTAIIIQINDMNFDINTMEEALNQRSYSDEDSIDFLLQHRTVEETVLGWIKKYFPLVSIIVGEKYPKLEKGVDHIFVSTSGFDCVEEPYTNGTYEVVLDKALKKIREEYERELIILYLPPMEIKSDGMIIKYSEYYTNFVSVCRKYDIRIVDMGEKFLENYQLDYAIPYGFNNTLPGEGHLNKEGHAMVAQVLYKLLTVREYK